MELATPRTTAAMPWLLLIIGLAATATGGGVLQALAQSHLGFISIDCGLPGETGYVDNTTTLSYTTDTGFIDDDAGTNHNISVQAITPDWTKSWYTVRSFPNGARNCYTLDSLVSGLKYLIRAKFMYGNYDGLSQLPIFDLYVGVNFWTTVIPSKVDAPVYAEAIVVVPDDFVQVCLVNTGGGTPFISGLDLRPLKSTLYPLADDTLGQGLVLLYRFNFGSTNPIVRYPDDPYDRIWLPWVEPSVWHMISTTESVKKNPLKLYEAPMVVMQTAITPQNVFNNLQFRFDHESLPKDPSLGYASTMYFCE